PSSDVVAAGAFTDAAVLARHDLGQYRRLLFSTHAAQLGRLGARCWPDPFLVTSQGPATGSSSGGDGVLETSEIAGLTLDADMVVLSACDTGAFDNRGEALGGLAQSFFFAGSRSLVVSHWSVNSLATRELMTAFLSENGGGKEA